MSNTQEAYIQTLKQIKNAEDLAEKEINEYRLECEKMKKDLQSRIEQEIQAVTTQGENLVATSIEQAKNKAVHEADAIIREAENKAQIISKQSSPPSVNKVLEILLRGIE
jgi:vacuolar-type H+-ATPase subunit H